MMSDEVDSFGLPSAPKATGVLGTRRRGDVRAIKIPEWSSAWPLPVTIHCGILDCVLGSCRTIHIVGEERTDAVISVSMPRKLRQPLAVVEAPRPTSSETHHS